MTRAVVLLSGGLDSATTLAVAQRDGHDVFAMTFRYGQRHAVEIRCAQRVAERHGVREQRIVDIDLRQFGGSALTSDIPVPKSATPAAAIPVTYVPARNTIFLAYALAWAEVLDAGHIYIGVNALDYSGYPDCRPEFIEAFQRLAGLATRAGVEGQGVTIAAPLLDLDKAGIIALGTSLGVDYALTSSCYDPGPDGGPCGACEACRLRLKGFADAGLRDPLEYADRTPTPHPPR